MPPGLNAPRKVAGGRSELIHGDEIAATATTTRGKKNMKRAKRVSAGADCVDCSSTEDLSSHLEPAGPKSKKRFVGVRQRPSGRWVAEIKDTTQKIRLWLGTFDSAEEGAKAYDSAARALRGANTRTNFVPAIASTCETTTSVPTKAARLIRLRQTAAAASSKPCAGKFTKSGLDQPDLNGTADVHSQGTKDPENNHTSETLSNAINHSLAEDHSRVNPSTCNAADEPPKQENLNPCRADAETASSADDNEVMDTGNNDAVHTNNNNRADDAESPLREDHQLDHRNNNNSNPVLDMIPWPDYVLMDGLDLSCETTGVYPAFDFSEEAMDRDSEHYLSDDSSEFLLTLQQPCTNQSSFQTELSTERSPVSVLKDDSTDTDECQSQADQALWSSMDLAPLCMVA